MKFKTMTLLALLAANSFFLPGAMLHGADTPAEKAEFARYMEQAEKGDAGAMNNLGWCYKNGNGVEKNYEEAVKWYKKAAEKGDASAMNNLGHCYYYGEGVEKNYEEAVKWYRKAAEKGDAWAMRNLGICYDNGEGIEKNEAEAEKWYKKAFPLFLQKAKVGNAGAMCNLGNCYYNGNGVEKNYEEAVKWFKKAAEKGNDTAMNNLGACYENGEGVEKNYEEAVKWFTKAAELGHIGAVKNLARCYRDGEGVEEDDTKAFELYQQILASDKATEKQKEDAHEEIAKAYLFGNGAEWSIPLAHWHFKQAGHPHWYYWMLIPAVVVLGFMLLFKVLIPALGQLIEKIKVQRKVKKAEAGNAEAMYELGVCYEHGKGVKKNIAEAVKWYRKAAENGCKRAMNRKFYTLADREADHSRRTPWMQGLIEMITTVSVTHTTAILCGILGGFLGGHLGGDFVCGCLCIFLGIVIGSVIGSILKDHFEFDIIWFLENMVEDLLRKKAAAAGDANAMAALGEYYVEKEGEKNRAKAILWLQRAANAEHSGALTRLAKYYREGIGVEKDEEEAERLEKRSAAKHRKNQEEAVTWYRIVAEQGDASAMYQLGLCYANGNGVEKDETEAIKWLEKAVELDNTDANAATLLGVCYYNEKNYSEAIKWLEKAAELGDTDAKAATLLGLCYYNEKNYTEAIKWFEKAVKQGNTNANVATLLRDCYDHSNQKDEAEAEAEKE